jgi:glycosyltransferase involved in cell wall biosynthesis
MELLVGAHDLYPDPGSGGTGRYVYETARRLADRGHSVSVLTRWRGDVPARETVAGVRVARYDLSVAGEPAPRVAAQLPSALRTVRGHLDALPDPNVVSLQGPVTGPLLDLFAGSDPALSATFHSPWPTEYRIRAGHEDRLSAPRRRVNAAVRGRIERRTLAGCDEVLTLSRFMAGRLRESYGRVADPAVVPGGVDLDRYRPDAGTYGPMADGDGEFAFLTVRRLSPRMGHAALLDAFARVAADRPDARLYVAGDGPLRGELERRADALGVGDRVAFLGYVPDDRLPSAYATADCFVLPTTALEGFGLATLEALASGAPVIATPVGATTEILSGLDDDRVRAPTLVESADPAALAEGMAAWADRPADERAAAGRACREYVRENYTWERTTDALEARYAALA